MTGGYGPPPELWKVIVEHQVGVTDADMRMHQLASRSGRSRNLDRIERAFQKINVVSRSSHSEVSR